MQSVGGSCRFEGDLQSHASGEDAAEQCHPCLHSFKSEPRVFPSPCAARPLHRLTKARIHQRAAASYNPSERQQAMPALPWLVLETSSFLANASPGLPWLTPVHADGFEGLRTSRSGFHRRKRTLWVSKSYWSGYIPCGSSMISVPGAIWFCAHIPPTDKLLHSLAAPDGVNLLCFFSLSLFLASLLPFVPRPALAISLYSSPWHWNYSSQCVSREEAAFCSFHFVRMSLKLLQFSCCRGNVASSVLPLTLLFS